MIDGIKDEELIYDAQKNKASIYENLALVYFNLFDEEKGIEYLGKSLESAESSY
jgi:hypothetical protein